MMRIAVIVGCDTYESSTLPNLQGAEIDAMRIADALDKGTDKVIRLLSPTTGEVNSAFAVLARESVDDLTFYFAGHGEVRDDRLFLCLRNSDRDCLAASALSFANLLVLIQDCKPRHANIIIDACQSGGVVGDISASLNPRTIGAVGSFGLSLLAACTRDQLAMEYGDGGVCTSALVNCISGSTFVQDIADHLDLMEVSKFVATSVSAQTQQTPVYWGIHLTGSAKFCANPHVAHDSPVRRALGNAAELGQLSKALKLQIARLHSLASDELEPAEVRDVLLRACEELQPTSEQKLQFSRQISTSLAAASRDHLDPFRTIGIRSACLSLLVGDCLASRAVSEYVEQQVNEIARDALAAVEQVNEQVRDYKYSLIGDTGTGELFFLPLRISKILGWSGFAIRVLGIQAPDFLSELLDAIKETYPLSCAAISEDQAPFVFVAAEGFYGSNAHDQFETILSLLFSDAALHRAVIASSRLPDAEIVEFLLRRKTAKFDGWRWLANPSGLVFSILLSGARFGLEQEFDDGLSDLDHCCINAFIPITYADFACSQIQSGTNLVFRVGHDIWRVADLASQWSAAVAPAPNPSAETLLATLCSLVFPDRIPWCFAAHRLEVAAGTPRGR